MSILDHREIGLEALYTDLQRVAAHRTAPECTSEQVRHVLQHFGYQRYSRSEALLCLYWQLAEDHLDEWPCEAFLAQLRQLMGEEELSDSSYYGQYALDAQLKYSPLLQVLRRRKQQTPSAKTVILSGVAKTGKSIAMQQLPVRLAQYKVLLVTLPPQRAPGRKIT